MTRHARNSTAGTVYTYHERKKDTAQSGYGTKSTRFGKDSVKEFDCCCLTLQPCQNPVVTPEGYLFDKEAILKYIIHQKKEIARKLKEFEKQKTRLETEVADLKKAEEESKKVAFAKRVCDPIRNQVESQKKTEESSLNNMKQGRDKSLPSFWVPNNTPQAETSLVKKPDEKVRCPMSGKPLKLKNLTDVKFTDIKDGDTKTSLIAKTARFVCPVTNDVLGNSVPCAVLRTSGSVVTMECVEKLIKKDMLDPINGKKMLDRDIIALQRGATGFAGTGLQLNASIPGSSLQA